MRKQLQKLIVFKWCLSIFAFFAKRKWSGIVKWLTDFSAWLNLTLNKPKQANTPAELAKTWQDLMPPDGRDLFRIREITNDTAYVEIHLHCPLHNTGNVKACCNLMNYDRKLMDKVGGNLVVLSSQSNNEKGYCSLAIRDKRLPSDDLVSACEP